MTSCGRICLASAKINLSTVFAGQNVGIKEVDEKIWLVSFMHYDLGFFDEDDAGRAGRQPLRRESVTHVSGIICNLCAREGPIMKWWPGRNRTIDTRIFSPLLYQLSYLAIRESSLPSAPGGPNGEYRPTRRGQSRRLARDARRAGRDHTGPQLASFNVWRARVENH